jgi:hypothetical protein
MTTILPPTEDQLSRMRRNILTEATLEPRRRRTRSVLLVAAIVGGMAVATTAGAIVVRAATVDAQNTSFDCYTSDDLNSAHGTTAYVNDGRETTQLLTVRDRVAKALQTCEAGYQAVETGASTATGPDVPNPTACVLSDARIAVLPNAKSLAESVFCSNLGLAAPQD